MLNEYAKMTWDDVQDSNYQFKCNNIKHVIQISGEELGGPTGSLLLTYYNLYTGLPMIMVWNVDGEDVGPIEDVEGYKANKNFNRTGGVIESTEITYISNEICEVLD